MPKLSRKVNFLFFVNFERVVLYSNNQKKWKIFGFLQERGMWISDIELVGFMCDLLAIANIFSINLLLKQNKCVISQPNCF